MLTISIDDQERLQFLQSVAKKVDTEDSQDALVYVSVAVAQVKLSLGDLDEARKDLDNAERILDSFDSVEVVVHAAFYDANASYYQVCKWMASFQTAIFQLTNGGVFTAQNGFRQLLSHSITLPRLY